MNKTLIVIILFLCMSRPAGAFEGPLSVKNQFPLFKNSYSPRLESALPEQSFSAQFSYSSVFMISKSQEWDVSLDMELAELGLIYRHKVGAETEIGIEVPVLNLNKGFMDGFLHDFHKTFGFPDAGRQARPNNEFLYEVRRNGVLQLRGRESGAELGDIRLWTKRLLRGTDPAISISAGVELPTGDAKKGFGSGSLDAGIAVFVDKRLSDTVTSYYNLGMIFPGDIRAEQTIRMKKSFYGGAAVEAMIGNNFGLIGQVMVYTSPFPKTGISNIDGTGMLLILGGRYVRGKDSFELSLTEDPGSTGATDFTVNMSYKRKF